jgi:hypothetical protein
VIAKPDSAFIEIDSSWDPLFADDLVQEPGIKVDLNLLGEALDRGALDVDDLEKRPRAARICSDLDEVRTNVGEGGELWPDLNSVCGLG